MSESIVVPNFASTFMAEWCSLYFEPLSWRSSTNFEYANDSKVENLCHDVSAGAWQYFQNKLFPKYFSGFSGGSQIATYFETCTKLIHGSNYFIRM